ncbi:MAG: hypothetical protein HY821_22225 [Acidobacteria bacterium]|nr:hypothetical protein [Acidobacteriota bacterium]
MKSRWSVWLFAGIAAALAADGQASPPITVEMVPGRNGFARFENREHAGNRIGYRFHEHKPMVEGAVPRDAQEAGIDVQKELALVRAFETRRGVVRYELEVKEKEWAPQKWTFLLAPAADGIEMLLQVEARETGLNSYYGVQQCFRMSGATNEGWRQEVARTPAFSEFDWWKALESEGKGPASMTHVLRLGNWEELPARKETVGARTPLGVQVDRRLSGGDLAKIPKVGPYEALMLAAVDSGLITRVSRDGDWISGIYWERTSHVTDHHPADCLHAILNIGGIPAGGTRVLRGKIYWFRGGLDELRKRWKQEFGGSR